MSQRWELAVVCWTLSLLRFAMALLAMVEDLRIPSQLTFDAEWNWVITVVLSVGAANDILIAAGLTYFLRGSRSGLAKSDRIVNKIIRFTIRAYRGLQTLSCFSWKFRDWIAYQHACSDHARLSEWSPCLEDSFV